MISPLQSRRRPGPKIVCFAAGLLLATVGVMVIVGWVLDLPTFKSISPGWATMKVDTAVCFILAGVALWCLGDEYAGAQRRNAGLGCAALVTLIALLTLVEYALEVDLGIDQLLLRQPAGTAGAASSGRMSVATATGFLLSGLALLGLDWKNRRGHRPMLGLALPIAAIGLLGVTGYVYGVRALYAFSPFSSMAVHTAALFLTLSIGILCARRDPGPFGILLTDNAGGRMARRILPLAILLPLLIGWLRLQGERAGLYGFELGLALFATSNALIFAGLIWVSAASLNRRDAQREQSEVALREERARLAGLIDSAMDAVVTVDATQRITLFNPAAEQMFGYPAERMIGQPLDRLIPARHRSSHAQHIRDFGQTGVSSRRMGALGAISGLRANGEEFPLEASISQIEVDGRRFYTAILRDITERKRAEQALVAERTLLRTLVDALPDVVFTKDLEARFSMCNQAALNHSGFTRPEDLTGKSVFDLYPRELAEIYHTDDVQVLSGQPVLNREEPSVDAAGNRRWFLTNKVPLRDPAGRIVGLVGISHDITQRKQADEEIRRLNAELEERVAQRTAELHARNRELETFSYTVSHDLKAPLRGIDGYSRLLLEDYGGKLDEEARRFLAHIRSATAHMQQLIDDLLAYSKLERRTLSPTRVDLRALVNTLLKERAHDLAATRLSVDVSPDPVLADRESLTLALRNLIDNAVKFSRGRTPPMVEIFSRIEDQMHVVSVRDNGTGFDMKYHDRIFQIFQRLHRAEDYPGTGVGLAIVQMAASRMGGRVWAQSEPGKGAVFHLALPRISARPETARTNHLDQRSP